MLMRHLRPAALPCLLLVLIAAPASAQTSLPQFAVAADLDEVDPRPGAPVPLPIDMPELASPPALMLDEAELAMMPSVPVPQNRQVQAYIKEFTTTRKKFIELALSRGARYLPMIQAIFKGEGLPQELVYLPIIESAFRVEARSHAGASGMWQMMRTTATSNGLSRDWYVDERLDPEKSTRAAARLLRTLYGMFGDWHLTLAAYNAGAGRVQRAMKRSQQTSFWNIARTGTTYLPKETREYVPLFLASIIVARDPLAYGLNVAAQDAMLHDVVALTTPLDLRRAAEWLDVTVDSLRALNPELRRWTTPVRADEYRLRVPAGLGALLQARLLDGTPSDLARHVVKKGETLLAVARKLKVTRDDLAEANYLPVTARLKAGDTLIVPREPELLPQPSTLLAFASPPGYEPDTFAFGIP
jgi:membrane-bound lytic murein transglycosylase D